MASNSSRLWLKLIGPPVAAGGAWMLYGLMVTGRALPNAFWIKARGGLALGEQLDALRALFLAGPSIAVALVIVVIIVGLRSLRVERQHLLLALPAVTILAVYLLILPLGRDNGPLASGSAENIYYARYPLVILPWILVWIALGAVAVLNIAKNLLARWTSASAANALAMVSVLLLASFVAPSWQGHRTILAQAYRANCAEIQRTQVAMGKWIDENLDEDAVIAVSDAGAMRFYARRQEIIDLIGLNTHDMIRQADPLDWIDARGLTHVAIWPAWHQPLLHSPRWTIQVIIQMHNDQQTVVAGEYLTLYHLERRP